MPWPHWTLALPASAGGALFGAAWAAIPAYLQATRGSHIVITTIMFNFIASALLVYLLVNVLKVPGSMAPETARFPEGARLPSAYEWGAWLGFGRSAPLNVAFFVALACCVGRLGADLEDAAGIRDPCLRQVRTGRALCRHPSRCAPS